MSNRAERRREGRQTDRRGGGQKAVPAILNPGISQKRSPVGDLLHAAGPNIASMKPSQPPAPPTMAEAAGTAWARAEEARLRGDHPGFITAASATLDVRPDHVQAVKAIRRERTAVAVQRALQDEYWETDVWRAQDFISGLPADAPCRAAVRKRYERLADNWRGILRSDPRNLLALSRLGALLEAMGRFEEALGTARRALAVLRGASRWARRTGAAPPGVSPTAFLNAEAGWLRHLGRHGEAAEVDARLLCLLDDEDMGTEETGGGGRPDARAGDRLLLRALALSRLGRYAEALACAERAAALAPDSDHCRSVLGWALVRMGHVSRGYTELAVRARPLGRYLGAGAAQWDGSPLAGRRLRVCSWEGLGDGLQYARYVPLLNRLGGSVLLVCDDGTERLFRSLRCDALTVVPWSLHRADHLASVRHGSRVGWDKPWDLDIALDQLPCLFSDTPPTPQGYLDAAPEDVERMRAFIGGGHEGSTAPLRVGLVWAGNPDHDDDRNRSLPLALLAPLGEVPGARFFALQKGRAAEAQETPDGMDLIRLGPHLRDMAATAAAMHLLDIIITVDSSPCHLAGAMGVPVWTLLPEPSEWRWQVDRLDTPWYSSMRLFRQREPGDWPEVIGRVAAALGELAARRGGRADQEG